jgi:hypothetical protein
LQLSIARAIDNLAALPVLIKEHRQFHLAHPSNANNSNHASSVRLTLFPMREQKTTTTTTTSRFHSLVVFPSLLVAAAIVRSDRRRDRLPKNGPGSVDVVRESVVVACCLRLYSYQL